jgi:cytochrome c biogenesis protein CcdA
MDAVLLSVLGIAVLDSINPSALVATIALLLRGGSYTPKVLTYVTGIFVTYFGIGAALMLGLGAAGSVLRDGAVGTVAYGAQGVLGAAMLGYALFAPSKPKPRATGGGGVLPRSLGPWGLLLLGATVTAVEFTTALPYLGAIGIMTAEALPVSRWLPLLLAYNAIFVAPPLLLLAAYRAFGPRLRARLARQEARWRSGSRETLLWIVGLVGFYLIADSLSRLGVFGG